MVPKRERLDVPMIAMPSRTDVTRCWWWRWPCGCWRRCWRRWCWCWRRWRWRWRIFTISTLCTPSLATSATMLFWVVMERTHSPKNVEFAPILFVNRAVVAPPIGPTRSVDALLCAQKLLIRFRTTPEADTRHRHYCHEPSVSKFWACLDCISKSKPLCHD